MKKFLCALTLLCALILALTLCSCGGETGGTNNPDNGGNEDEQTWRPITGSQADPQEVYKNLVTGIYGTMADVSTSRLNSSNPICSLDSTIDFTIVQGGETKNLTLRVIANFNISKKSDNKVSCEITNTDKQLVLGAYFFAGNCYIALGNSEKLAIKMDEKILNDLLPLDMSVSKPVKDIVKIMDSIIAVQSNGVTGRYRQNGSNYEYDYNVSIDLTGSISKLSKALDEGTEIKNLDKSSLRLIIKSVTGIDMNYMKFAPASEAKISFSTVDKKMTAMKADLLFAESQDKETVFDGQETKINIQFSDLTVDTKFTGIPFFADYKYNDEEYQNYLSKGYGAVLDVKQEFKDFNDPEKNIPETDYQLKLEAKIDDVVSENNKILIEVADGDDNTDKLFGLYIYAGKAYVYHKGENSEYGLITSCNIDVIDVVKRLRNGESVVNEKASALVSLAGVLGALKIGPTQLDVRITKDFYATVWRGFDGIVEYVDNAATDIDLVTVLHSNNLDLINYMKGNNFDFTIPLTEEGEGFSLYVIDDEIVFPEN